MVNCITLGVTGYIFQIILFLSLKIFFVLANSLDPEEMLCDGTFNPFVCFDSVSPSQHFFSHVGTSLPGLSQY